MSATTSDRPRLPVLTSVRFFAALWVALFHMQAMQAFVFGASAVRRFASVGYSGVSFFFVLSGFILVYTYAGRLTTQRDFWQARFARIYPALAFSLLITAPGFFFCCIRMRAHDPHLFVPEWSWAAQHLPLTILLSLTLLQSWIPQTALAWNMPAWSLSVEAFFYFTFPFLLPRLSRLSRRNLLAILPLGCALTLVCTLAYTHLRPDGPDAITFRTLGPWINTLKFNPFVHLPEFLMGMATGLVFLRTRPDQRTAWPLILSGLAAVAAVVSFAPHIPYLAIHTALLAPAFAVLITGLALQPAGLSLLKHPAMETLGEASYPFYLLHSMLIGVFFLDFKTGIARHQSLLGFATWLLLSIAVALLVDRLIERPLRRLLRPKPRPISTSPLPIPAQA